MGLGKTLQTISFLSYLRHYRGIPGPHFIIVPKSTLQNWASELKDGRQTSNASSSQAKEERAEMIQSRLISNDFDICVTSYETCLIEKSVMKMFSFQYIVIDEAHRIRNVDSMLAQIVRTFTSRGRVAYDGHEPEGALRVAQLCLPGDLLGFGQLFA